MAALVFRSHAIRRMFERGLSVEDVRAVLDGGQVIERRDDDLPYPSRLISGRVRGRPLHVVTALDRAAETVFVVTVYEPDPALWRAGFTRRRP